ncbi:MAG: hypothetical protein H7A35_02645 [Planctomycetales bacterium]|nr:hypothetical protein [bacterium]UNM08958.1 MAG: hypothetical protein H7A35_02645 [Planctomycetales bacterium]
MNKLLDATASLAARLDGRMLLQYVESCPSTSDLVKEQFAVRGLTEPLLVCTDAQPEGRGTRGRSWSMQPGQDIAFSLGLPLTSGLEPSPRLPLALSVLLGQSISNLVREQWRAARLYQQEDDPGGDEQATTGERVTRAINEARDSLASRICAVKWPNDLLMARRGLDGELQYRKCGGILTEHLPGLLVIGIGLNVNSTAADFAAELAARLTTVRDCCGIQLDREALFSGIVMRLYGKMVFNGILQGYSAADDSAIRELEPDWRELDRSAGQRWLLNREGKTIPVTATHVDFASGHLYVQDEAGNQYEIESYSELESQ